MNYSQGSHFVVDQVLLRSVVVEFSRGNIVVSLNLRLNVEVITQIHCMTVISASARMAMTRAIIGR